jgi:hypothetical protein
VICGATGGGYVICGASRGYVICRGGECYGWLLRRNGKIDSMPEVVLDWFGRLVVKKANDRMVSIASSEGSNAWYG